MYVLSYFFFHGNWKYSVQCKKSHIQKSDVTQLTPKDRIIFELKEEKSVLKRELPQLKSQLYLEDNKQPFAVNPA